MQLDAELAALDHAAEARGAAALPELQAAVDRFAAAGDAHRLAWARAGLARALAIVERFDEADAAAAAALAHFRADGDVAGCALALNAQGFAALRRGLPSHVLAVLDEAVQCAHEADDPRLQVRVANTVGAAMNVLGRLSDAVQVLEDGLRCAAAVPDEPVLVRVRSNLAWARAHWALREQDAGVPESAWRPRAHGLADELEAALVHWRAARGEPLCGVLDDLSVAYLVLGRIADAHAALDEAETTIAVGEQRFTTVSLSCTRARIHLRQDEPALALRAARRALAAALERGGHYFIDEAWRLISVAHERLGELRESLDAHKRFHELRTRLVLSQAEQQASALTVVLATRRALRQAGEERLRADRSHREARRDVLTGLPNRRAFDEQLAAGLATAAPDRPLALVLVDLDHLKAINDRHGHAGGDAALRWIASHLPAQCGPDDFAARLGGDEFALVLRVPLERAHAACLALRAAIAGPAPGLPADLAVRASAGIAVADAACDASRLLRRADDALYAAKAAGRDAVEHAPRVAPAA